MRERSGGGGSDARRVPAAGGHRAAGPLAPAGNDRVDLHDADDKPVPARQVTLGILINSVAKGDSRKHLQAHDRRRGPRVFPGLDMASNVAYRVSAGYQGGAFAATPFQLRRRRRCTSCCTSTR